MRAFLAIVDSERGLSVQEVSEMLGVHRSIAYRLLQTLVEYDLVARSREGVYLPGDRLAELSDTYLPEVRSAAAPVMRELADLVQSTISLFVEQDGDGVAIMMVEPTTATHHIAFRPGMRSPMDRGAVSYAIRAGDPPAEDEPEAVRLARERGYAFSYGEVESGAYAVARHIGHADGEPRMCLNLTTYQAEVAESAGEAVGKAADEATEKIAELRSKVAAATPRGRSETASEAPTAAGSQTFSRGLRAFLAVAKSDGGMTVQQVSEMLGIHRTIAYRMLRTLVDFGLITQRSRGRYVGGARLATLADAYVPRLQDIALPVMQRLADGQGATVLLFIEHRGEAVAVSLCEPRTGSHHIAFRAGMRTPMDRGAAAFALRAGKAPVADEPDGVADARKDGVARSMGAVLPGAYGVAAPIPRPQSSPACLMLVTFVDAIAERAVDDVCAAAAEVGAAQLAAVAPGPTGQRSPDRRAVSP